MMKAMPSSNHFQHDLVSFQLQIKHSPAVLPGGPFTDTSNPFRWPLVTQRMLPGAETSLFSCPECCRSWVGASVQGIVGVEGDKPRYRQVWSLVAPKDLQDTAFPGTQFQSYTTFGKERLSSSTRWSPDQNVCIRTGDWLLQPGLEREVCRG